MSNNTFRSGDVVRLKSGSQTMTVSSVSILRNNKIECVWMSDDIVYRDDFVPEVLRRDSGGSIFEKYWGFFVGGVIILTVLLY